MIACLYCIPTRDGLHDCKGGYTLNIDQVQNQKLTYLILAFELEYM